MATYKPGIDENHVIKTVSSESELDLTVFIKAFIKLKNDLMNIPQIKTEPDEETLEYWNEFFVLPERERIKASIDSKAERLYGYLKAIKEADLLPSKYDNEYKQLENYINSL